MVREQFCQPYVQMGTIASIVETELEKVAS